ncbi:MAG: beta-N-acetylhexosaminidase, partial [Flavitalea sp.]
MKIKFFFSALITLVFFSLSLNAQETILAKAGIDIIPYPQQAELVNGDFIFDQPVSIELDKNAPEEDLFAARELASFLEQEFHIAAPVSASTARSAILITRRGFNKKIKTEGYQLSISPGKIIIRAGDGSGIFYGVQTLMQIIQRRDEKVMAKGMKISDWPNTAIRAAHYDTKHHQDKRSYVEELIRELAKYKTNMLVWEWEDKLEYPSHPEIGAPGAFSLKDIQEITAYAKKYHVQLTPLVQGLGHVSFILKWPQYASLREIYASNFEFCPLKEGSYKLLFDLWDDAIKATPGSAYIHIGADETYELGECEACRKKAEEIGKSGLYHLFTSKAAAHLQKLGRKVMVWEAPMNWKQEKNASLNIHPQKGLVLTESYSYETPDLKYAKEAKALGYPVFAYDPNPGIEPLFLPYFYKQNVRREHTTGSLEDSYNFLTNTMDKGVFDGVIRTSWDDSGLPVQGWMLQFIACSAYSWNASSPGLSEFTSSFFKNYFGDQQKDIQRLFLLLNEGAYYYSETLERNVWHFGAIGKTHLPDLPRADDLEYDPYWNIEYADQVNKAGIFLNKMNEAIAIGKGNIDAGAKHAYDIALFVSIAELIRHTALTYLDLSRLEYTIT